MNYLYSRMNKFFTQTDPDYIVAGVCAIIGLTIFISAATGNL